MNSPDTENKQTTQTLEHLLGVVLENREQRCTDVSENTHAQAQEILKLAHTRVRARLQRHILILREKYRTSISAAQARNHILIRQRNQKADSVCLETAWPILREALLTLWKAPESRLLWINAAISNASSTLLGTDWRIEYPRDFTDEENELLKQLLRDKYGRDPELAAGNDIEAGIRILAHRTVVDATLEGVLQQKSHIEAILIARIKQDTQA